ncbi:hypothetical protein ACFL6S_06710, partial [Candidatus Poribacteria bacterium]
MLLNRKRRGTPGAVPGALVSEGVPAKKVRMTVISYSADELEEKDAESVAECFDYVGKREVTWIDLDGTQDAEL